MKNIILATSIFIATTGLAHAQVDYCKMITKKVDEMKGETTFQTPDLSSTNNIYFSKLISDGSADIFIRFYTTKSIADYDAKGLYVKFEDGTLLKYPNEKVVCSYLDAQKGYLYLTGRIFDDTFDPIQPYQTKKIVKIQIADKDIDIPDDFATKLKAWANCIVDMK